jgi:hypothetical protein
MRIDIHSTDAVTGRQLQAINQNIDLLSIQMMSTSNQIVAILGGGANFSNRRIIDGILVLVELQVQIRQVKTLLL